MTTFDSIHTAALQPPEARICAPGEHVADASTFRVSHEDLPAMVALVDCEMCGATGANKNGGLASSDFADWEA